MRLSACNDAKEPSAKASDAPADAVPVARPAAPVARPAAPVGKEFAMFSESERKVLAAHGLDGLVRYARKTSRVRRTSRPARAPAVTGQYGYTDALRDALMIA